MGTIKIIDSCEGAAHLMNKELVETVFKSQLAGVQQQSHHYNRPECATPYPPSKVKLNVPIEIPQGTGCHVSPRASFIILKLMVSLYCFMAKFAVIFTIVKKSGLGGLSFQTFYHLVRILSFLYLSLSLESLSLLSLSFLFCLLSHLPSFSFFVFFHPLFPFFFHLPSLKCWGD